jgi:hypothetical protein
MIELNPDNLPVIEENSLHRIVTTVKLYKEFNELGQEKFEEIYSQADPKSLEGVCYERYYKNYQKYRRNKPFELLNSPFLKRVAGESQSGYSLELGEYLKVDLDENKNVISVESQKPFYWKEWSFEEDIEREDYTMCVKKMVRLLGILYQTKENLEKITKENLL